MVELEDCVEGGFCDRLVATALFDSFTDVSCLWSFLPFGGALFRFGRHFVRTKSANLIHGQKLERERGQLIVATRSN